MRQPQLPRRGTEAITRRSAAALIAALPAFLATSQRADAAFGPAGGAVLSKPPLQQLDFEALINLSPEKLAQRVGAISGAGIDAYVEQIEKTFTQREREALDAVISRLEAERKLKPSPEVDAELKRVEDQVLKAKRALTIAQQLRDRQRLEAKLAAQPQWIAYGCAGLASIGSTLITHPVDTYKTLQQTGGGCDPTGCESPPMPEDEAAAAAAVTAAGGAVEAQSAVETVAPTLTTLPPLADLYRGLIPNIVKEAPSSALYLGVYEICRGYLNGPGGLCANNLLLGYLLAGAAGELVGSVVRAPSEAAKTRVQSGAAGTVREAVEQVIFDDGGRRNTVRAWGSSLLRDVPMGAIQIAIFEVLKAYVIQAPDLMCAPHTFARSLALSLALALSLSLILTRIHASRASHAATGSIPTPSALKPSSERQEAWLVPSSPLRQTLSRRAS